MRRLTTKALYGVTLGYMSKQISRLSFRDRCIFVLKGLTFVLLLVAAVSGRPPAKAQNLTPGCCAVGIPSGEDIKQDGDIAYMKSGMDIHRDAIKELVAISVEQGKDIARLDTKVTIFFWLLSALVGGQIGFGLLPKKG
jgi:hypothetical protein